jgi:SPP1 gp7 family putative phage head morphogenesis protein
MNKNVQNTLERKLIENQQLIKSIPTGYLDDFEHQLVVDTASGKPLKEIIDDLQKTYDLSKGKAVRLAQTETSKINSALTQARSESLGLSQYIWHCAFLPTSRQSHEGMEGMVVDYDNPPTLDDWTAHAGEFIYCYCWQEPVILKEGEDPVLEGGDFEDDESSRGEDGSIDSNTADSINEQI